MGTIAVHEAGHAVIARALGHEVIQATHDLVRTRHRVGDRRAHLHEAAIALASPLAELRCRPTTPAERRRLCRVHWHSDIANTREHIAACGADAALIERQVRSLVRRHWAAIEAVAEAIEQRGALTGAEIDALMALV